MDALAQFQADTLNLLLGNPATAMVPYTSFKREVMASVADEAAAAWRVRQAGKVGIACLVLMPSARVKDPNVPGPQFMAELIVRTFEDPKINNTGLTAEGVAIANYKWLDALLIEDLTETFADDGDEAVRANYSYPGYLVYDSVLRGWLPQDYLGRTTAPSITEAGGHVTLSCPDAGSVMYYTTDGSAPTPGAPTDGNPSTVTYHAPFAAVPGQVVRAVAWVNTVLPSHVAKGTIV
jgi:hypothetical protein